MLGTLADALEHLLLFEILAKPITQGVISVSIGLYGLHSRLLLRVDIESILAYESMRLPSLVFHDRAGYLIPWLLGSSDLQRGGILCYPVIEPDLSFTSLSTHGLLLLALSCVLDLLLEVPFDLNSSDEARFLRFRLIDQVHVQLWFRVLLAY